MTGSSDPIVFAVGPICDQHVELDLETSLNVPNLVRRT